MKTIKPYKNRNDLLDILSEKQIKLACEVGVQAGVYSRKILTSIPSLKNLYLVDLWEKQENYADGANSFDQQEMLHRTQSNTNQWKHKVKILKGYSTEMASKIKDNTLDWCYIDARHDYVGCMEDIASYWPKIKSGGIMSGHDYHDAVETKKYFLTTNKPDRDWSICSDGSINKGAVKGAVNDFASNYGLQVLVSYAENMWHTWSIIKP